MPDAFGVSLSPAKCENRLAVFPRSGSVQHLDSDLYASAKKQCITVIEAEMEQAKKNNDLPTAIGIGTMATNADFASPLILKDIETCTSDLRVLEAQADAAVTELRTDMTNSGTKVTSFTRNEYMTQQRQQGITLTETHINYIAMTWFSEASTWMGSIISLTPTKQDGWSYKSFGVQMHASYPQDQTFNFATEAERDAFLKKLTDVWDNWKKKWMNRLTVEVTARPYYWSERVFVYDIPYTLETISGKDKVQREDGEGAFRVKSSGDAPVKLRVRFCPAIWPEKKD
jgi:hypothetical protein